MTEDLYCTMNLRLSRRGSAITMYDAKLGVRRRLQLRGFVHDDGWYPGDGPDDSAPHFHGKPVVVDIHTPVGPDKFEKLRAGLAPDTAEKIFGVATVSAGVKVETVTVNDEIRELEPVVITLHLAPDAFEAIDQQAWEADEQHRILLGRITLAGPSIPVDKATRTDRVFGLRLKDLDVAIEREYLVRTFELVASNEFDLMRGRVRELQRQRGGGHTFALPVVLSEVRYEFSVERGIPHSITCSGNVARFFREPHAGRHVEIAFHPYDGYAGDEPPRQSAFGHFAHWTQGEAAGHFSFDLNYLPDDAMRIILPLLSKSAKDELTIVVEINTTQEALQASTRSACAARSRATDSASAGTWRRLSARTCPEPGG